jgi:quinol monooxygenase YgiN
MIYCTAEFKAKAGKEEELFAVLQALELPTHQEKGCIQYKVMRKINNPYAPGTHFGILFNEIWASLEAFEMHCEMPYIKAFFETQCLSAEGLVAQWNVNIFE